MVSLLVHFDVAAHDIEAAKLSCAGVTIAVIRSSDGVPDTLAQL